jgi:hypothetical protein
MGSTVEIFDLLREAPEVGGNELKLYPFKGL